MTGGPLILWFRRDLRLADQPMLTAAVATGRPLLPLFLLDPQTEAIGAAARWRLGLAIGAFADRLEAMGSRLVLRRGEAPAVLERLVAETGAAGVHWTRAYDPASIARDSAVKSGLKAAGIEAVSHPGALLHEPWEVGTVQGSPYRVFTPFWRTIRDRGAPPPLPAPQRLEPPASWPASDRLEDWRMGRAMNRGAAVLRPFQTVGEAAAADRLARFLDDRLAAYASARDRMDRDGGSGLSENLTYGEIGPRTLWHAALRRLHEGQTGADAFLRQLGWREFAWHLLYHFPEMDRRNWKPEWDSFPWAGDTPEPEAWKRGRTGVPLVDAAMREMYVTGRMHNRARMVVASYLTKHLLTHWRVGLDWFADCLTDWDPAANALNWQWVAGSGPDAAPFFRIFNPETQAARFDPTGAYRRRWIAELTPDPGPDALAFFGAAPRSWALRSDAPYPPPARSLAEGRARALDAYRAGRA